MGMPPSAYSFSLLRSVRIEMPRMLAAWVRLPRQCLSVSRMRSRSTSATVRPTSARVTCSAACAVGRQDRIGPDLVARRQQHGAVDGILELAHVAGPRIDGELAARLGGE